MSQAAKQSNRQPLYDRIAIPVDEAVFLSLRNPTWVQVHASWKGCGFISQSSELQVCGVSPEGLAEVAMEIKTQGSDGKNVQAFTYMHFDDSERKRLLEKLMTDDERAALARGSVN